MLNPMTMTEIRAEYEKVGLTGVALDIAMSCEQKMADLLAAAGPIELDVVVLRELCRKYETMQKEILDGLHNKPG